MSRYLRGLLALACALWVAGPIRAEPWDEEQYAAWLADHLLHVVAWLQLPAQFTLTDLRDLTIEQQRLLDEAAVVEPPARYAGLHARYREALEAVAQFQAGLQAVVLTRARVPGLGDLQTAALAALARFVGEAREAGLALPAYLVALLAPSAEGALTSPEAAPALSPGGSDGAVGAGEPPSTPSSAVAARGGALRVRGVGVPLVWPGSPGAGSIVMVLVRLENVGPRPLLLAPAGIVLEAGDGRRVAASWIGAAAAGRAAGLVLTPGQGRAAVVMFRPPSGWAGARPWQLRLTADDGGMVVVRLPGPR
ncbi:MAG TPA: hypothetical protein VKZ60_07215 [Chloroflexota bacterium]|jgi:hypothetical protein|nr:hypothetical protein [Chloroflexota bacterium]